MTAPDIQPAPASGEGEALRRQRANRIALWRSQILADRDDLTPLGPLLEAFEADVRAEASDEARETVRRVEAASDSDRRDVAAWLRREADERVKFFPQRRDGVDVLMRDLADMLAALGGEQAGDGGGLGCGCWTCDSHRRAQSDLLSVQLGAHMIVCPDCGNKRCPKATHHDDACSGSNDPGQDGSRYA